MIATDEPTVDTEPLFDTMVIEGTQSDGRLPDPASTDESDGCQALGLLDQFVTAETDPRR